MTDEKIGKDMYNIGCKLLKDRYGSFEGGVGVVRVEDGTCYTSVWNETLNSSVDLCAETGAILEAHKFNKKITHSLCVIKKENSNFMEILSPCGVCQERLFFFGGEVKCAISNEENKIIFKKLKELQPYYWKLDKK